MSLPTGWRSYDSVADEYERLTPRLFARLAHDLVEMLDPEPSALVLDAGTGTGTAAAAAGRRLGARGRVVGVEPSSAMRGIARARATWTVAAGLPGLPFPDRTFHAALANLVLSHLVELAAGTADLVRAVRPGGRVGVSAWPEDREVPESDAPSARRVLDAALDEVGLPRETPQMAAPAEEWLKEEGNLRTLLAGAGLADLTLAVRSYAYVLAPRDYLGWHAWAGRGRYLGSTTDEATLRRFESRARESLERQFPDGIRMVSHARLAIGTKRD